MQEFTNRIPTNAEVNNDQRQMKYCYWTSCAHVPPMRNLHTGV